VAKTAVIFVIALVFAAAALLHRVPAPPPIAARSLPVHVFARPGIAGSESIPNRFRVGSESIPNRYEDATTHRGRTTSFTQLRTSTAPPAPLVARQLDVTAIPPPTVASRGRDPHPSGHLSRAVGTAAGHTSGALRSAGRAIRSVF
jgi:hypothetical protein